MTESSVKELYYDMSSMINCARYLNQIRDYNSVTIASKTFLTGEFMYMREHYLSIISSLVDQIMRHVMPVNANDMITNPDLLKFAKYCSGEALHIAMSDIPFFKDEIDTDPDQDQEKEITEDYIQSLIMNIPKMVGEYIKAD